MGRERETYEARIEDVDVETEICRDFGTDAFDDCVDDSLGPHFIDVVGRDPQKTLAVVVFVVAPSVSGQSSTQSRVRGGAIDDETLVRRNPKHASVVEITLSGFPHRGILRRMPRIQMSIKV